VSPSLKAEEKGKKVEPLVVPPRNIVVKRASAPTNKTFAGADKRTGVERADAGKSPHWWTAPTPNSHPPLKLLVARRTTATTGSESAGARQARTGVAASQSNTNKRIGNHRRWSRGAGDGAGREGGCQTTSRQLPEVTPPALQCVSPTSLTVQPGGDRGATWASCPRPPGASESVSPPQTKKTWGTTQARQYVVARRETKGSKRRSRKTTSGSRLHRRGVAARIEAPVGAALENFEINKFHRNTFLMS